MPKSNDAGVINSIKKISLTAMMSMMLLSGCAVRGQENQKKINAKQENFIYREIDETEVILTLSNGKERTMLFGETSVKVKNTYEVKEKKDIKEIVLFIRWYADQKGYKVTRKDEDIIGECRLHNYLYELGYKKEQTRDSDLEYDKDKRWYVAVISKMIGWLGF